MADDKVQQLRAQMHEDAKSGIITLKTPLRAGGRDVTELAYDFGKLTGWEYADAMDMDPRAGNIYRITRKQALCLFAMATRTPVDTFMGMPLARFYDFAEAIAQVLKEMRSKG